MSGRHSGTATLVLTVLLASATRTGAQSIATPTAPAARPVYPGATGFGTDTPAGRGGRVVRVTTLQESGPGSLRAALDLPYPRIIVFDVGGDVRLTRGLTIAHPFVTIAGQTAPSPGITLQGGSITIRTHDVLMQHLRVRVGDRPVGPPPQSRDGIRLYGPDPSQIYNVVLDHLSVSWAVDELLSTYAEGGVTISNSIFSEGLHHSIHPEGPHSKGVFLAQGTRQLLLSGSLLAHNFDRNPAIKGNTGTVIANNVVYNWGNSGATAWWDPDDTGRPALSSIVGNVYLAGPNTPSKTRPFKIAGSLAPGSRIYLADNRWAEDGGDRGSRADVEARPAGDSTYRADTPPIWPADFTPRPSADVLEWVLGQAGARPGDRDSVDLRVVQDVRRRTGRIIDTPMEVGGWPHSKATRRRLELPPDSRADADDDGTSDLEELLHRLAAELEGRAPQL